MMKRLLFTLLLGGVFFPIIAFGQDGQNPTNYSSIAQQLVYSALNGDANANVLPSVATQNGFGSFLDNPASMALINKSYFNIGLASNFTEQNNSYLGNTSVFDNSKTQISNIGLIYSVPSSQGSFVVGGGYSINNQINRANLLSARNTSSTITDLFKNESSDYNSIAFESYAIDYGDVEQSYLESIFRIGFAPEDFPGIQQDAEISQQGSMGEFSIFTATEIKKNLFIGASLGVTYGTYSYERNFLESDDLNKYDGDFIDADSEGNGGTDIDNILLEDTFDSEIVGATLRAGIVYKAFSKLNIGTSVVVPTILIISEEYTSEITSNLDDGRQPFGDSFSGNFTYAVKRPTQLNFGLALEDINGFTISTSAELIDYRNTSIDLTRDSELSFIDEAQLRTQEAVFDSVFSADYKLVTNIKAGAKYVSKTGFELRGGVGILPGKSSTFSADKLVFNSGLGLPLSRYVYLDLSTQYSKWDDRSIVYEYIDSQTNELRSESVEESISQIKLFVGIKYRF